MVIFSGDNTATLPNVVATHLVGDKSHHIARGNLTLSQTPYAEHRDRHSAQSSSRRGSDAKTELPTHNGHAVNDPAMPVLLLRIGNTSWNLLSTTPFGAHEKDEKVYTFFAQMNPPEDAEQEDVAPDATPNVTQALTRKPEWVRLTLSPAVCAYKSPVQVGREKMEKLLVKHGLLDQADSPASSTASATTATGAAQQ